MCLTIKCLPCPSLQPDILRYLREYVKEVLKSRNKKTDGKLFDGFEHNYDSRRGDWEKIGEESIRPLMHYLTTNVITLKEWLCDVSGLHRAQY